VVRLTVQRPDAGVIHFTVVRQEVPVPALRSRLIRVRESKIGYVRLLSFPESAAERVGRATEILRDKGAKGLILDLRDNPGGLLSQAVGAAGLYLEEGVVCTIEGEHQERRVYEVKGAASFPRLPLVVLVNHGSASAAEILAAALSDHDRASLVGDRTYGKASVQSVKELPSGGALKLTTATYRTPAGQDIARRGVEPDFAGTDDPLTRPDEGVIAAEAALFKLFET
jgi:carboxyl-terminal processing protease